MRLSTVLMGVAATVWLGYEFWRLLLQGPPSGAIDLLQRHAEVAAWFDRQRVYGPVLTAVYPPATYLMLWPFLGWMGETPARWLWALMSIIAAWSLVRLTVVQTGARNSTERVFVGLIPLAIYPTGAAIGNGQLPLLLMAVLLAGLLLIGRPASCKRDVLAALCMLVALMKPSLTAPFFWILVFASGTLRPALLAGFGYVVLTLVAAAFQQDDLFSLLSAFVDRAQAGVEWGTRREGFGNQASWLAELGQSHLTTEVSLVSLFVLGCWVFWQRAKDLWLLIGVTALVARFWTYHQWYDDLLILCPMITLYRIAVDQPHRSRVPVAGALFTLTLATMIAPGGLYLLPSPWNTIYTQLQLSLWLVVLVYLLFYTVRSSSKTPVLTHPPP